MITKNEMQHTIDIRLWVFIRFFEVTNILLIEYGFAESI